MENENLTIKPEKKIWKRVLLIFLLIIFLVGSVVGGYFLYKHLFPTDKELFAIAQKNTIKDYKNAQKPERFTNTTTISLDAEGDFTSQKAAEAFSTVTFTIENAKEAEDKTEYILSVDFLGSEFFKSVAVKSGDTEVLTVPQLSEQSYGADSYTDVLSVLLGSERAVNVDITEGVDEERAEKYYDEYFAKILNNIPDTDFTSVDMENGKVITVKTDLNRALYETLNDMKSDTEFIDFSYEQTKIISTNINKKIPYAGTLITIPDKEEYTEEFRTNIDEIIKDVENSQILLTAEINKDRRIISKTLSVINDGKEQYYFSYSDEHFKLVVYDKDELTLSVDMSSKKSGSVTTKDCLISFDVNDFTKEKSEEQKMVNLKINSITDTNTAKKITLPEEYIDIRDISEEEKSNITQEASKKFVEIIATLTLELLS